MSALTPAHETEIRARLNAATDPDDQVAADVAALLAELDELRGQITEARDGWCRVCDRVCMG